MMMPKKPFHKLRGRMYEYGVTINSIAEHLGKSIAYVSHRFNGKYPFSLSDVYSISRMLDIDKKDIFTYFPDGGKD